MYLTLAGMGVLYFLLRKATLAAGWPHRPYLIYPSDPDFVAFTGLKVLYYLGGLFLYLPILPGRPRRTSPRRPACCRSAWPGPLRWSWRRRCYGAAG